MSDDDGPRISSDEDPSDEESEPKFLSFAGNDGEDVSIFLRDLKRKAISERRQHDSEWLVDEMEASLSGPALGWYFAQDDAVRTNFNKLRVALLQQFGGLARPAAAQVPPQSSSTDSSAPPFSPDPTPLAPEPSPAAPELPIAPPVSPKRGRIRLQTRPNGSTDPPEEVKGYLAKKPVRPGNAWVYELTRSTNAEDHLVVEVLELPDKTIRLVLVNSEHPWGSKESAMYLGLFNDKSAPNVPGILRKPSGIGLIFLAPCSMSVLGYWDGKLAEGDIILSNDYWKLKDEDRLDYGTTYVSDPWNVASYFLGPCGIGFLKFFDKTEAPFAYLYLEPV